MNLLQNYTIEQILTFIVALAIAVKGCISFIDWAIDRLRKAFETNDQPKKLKQKIQGHTQQIQELKGIIEKLSDKIDVLIKSDRDDIKAFITREHHSFCYDKGWIDDYSLDCIERRYDHYQQEGGNSFIATLMEELRALPKQRPQLVSQQKGAGQKT